VILAAVPLHASIVNGPTIAFSGPTQVLQTWDIPSMPAESLLPTGPNTGAPYITALAGDVFVNLYANVELAYGATGDGTGLFYNPNGTPGSYDAGANTGSFGGCAQGGADARSTLRPEIISTNCIGNYLINPNAPDHAGQYSASTQGLNTSGPNAGQTTSFSILFDVPAVDVAFQFYTMGVGALGCQGYTSTNPTVSAAESALGLTDADLCNNSYGTLIQAFSSTGELLDQGFQHYTSSASHQWTSVINNNSIAYITITDTGVNEAAGGTWNFTLGTVDPIAPEPGTILLMGLGLTSCAVFARRRKCS
jgi:hypothetical protein